MPEWRGGRESVLSETFHIFLSQTSLQVSFLTSLWNHPFFTLSCITLIGLFFAGIHKRVVAPSMYPFSASPLGTLPGEGGRDSPFQCRVSFNPPQYSCAVSDYISRVQHVL